MLGSRHRRGARTEDRAGGGPYGPVPQVILRVPVRVFRDDKTQSRDGSVGHSIGASVSPECCQPVAPDEILLASVEVRSLGATSPPLTKLSEATRQGGE